MRRFFLTASLLAFTLFSAHSQTNNVTARLKLFIKAWGFLKYHHPQVAAGSLDWDSVFVNNVQGMIDATKPTDFNEKLLNVIGAAGKPILTNLPKAPGGLFEQNKTGVGWIQKASLFSDAVKDELLSMSDGPGQDTNKYIKIVYSTANFDGEKKYEGIGFPDKAFRLLFLSRFWNIINYFAPYKYLTTPWDDVLERFIPPFINANNTEAYYKTLQGLSKSLNDGHSQLALNGQMLSNAFFGAYTTPFYCEIIDRQVVIRNTGNDSIAKSLNIQRGDVVLNVDGKEVSKIMAYGRSYISASNSADEDHQLSRFILDGPTPTVALELLRGDKIIKTTVTRISTQNRNWGPFINYTSNDVGYKKINDSILLIYAAQIWNGNLDTIKQLIKGSKAVIFDVRNYPQNDAFFYIADPFLSKPETIDYSTLALPRFPGLFEWKANPNKIGHYNDSAYKGKVVILCDERTQSQGEYSCMVLQTIPRAVTIGSQTAGADGIVTNIPMGSNLTISYSGYGVYYPDKRQTQRIGVRIDIPVKKTATAIRANKDEILERALLYAKNGN